jgi:hypothetical protein
MPNKYILLAPSHESVGNLHFLNLLTDKAAKPLHEARFKRK